jgi:pyrimidine-nucleoside phosphorylase
MSISISDFIEGVVDGSLTDDEIILWLKEVYENGMSDSEVAELTIMMRDSGVTLDWGGNTKVGDKHSTGGVGDKVSIPLAPCLAACGLSVPMISGRGLGHTGGTLDKLESIPGFNTDIDNDSLRRQVDRIGLAIIGQKSDLVPADKRLYSLRDVTGTVASIPLITSSIISKKAAEGITSLVLDVKFGRAAFMESIESARELAESMVGVSKELGISTIAVLSSMNRPIGYSVGNSLEILESVETMLGRGPADLEELVCVLGGLLLESSGISNDFDEGASMILDSLYDGSAFKKFVEMTVSQGGSADLFESEISLLEGLGLLDRRLSSNTIEAVEGGWIEDIDAMSIAKICLEMGAGRLSLGDDIDHQVGVAMEVQVGDIVEKGDILATVYHREGDISQILDRLEAAFEFSDNEPEVRSRIIEVIR